MIWVLPLSPTKLIPRQLLPGELVNGIRSLRGFGTVVTALALSVLYPRDDLLSETIPKDISRSTSYLPV